MKKILCPFVAILMLLVPPHSSKANTVYALGVGFSVDQSTLDAISAATTFYNLTGTDHGSSLPASLGATININEGGTLLLSGATAKTWEGTINGSTDTANSVTLFFRVYEAGTISASRPSFSSYNILYQNQWQPDATINKYWSSTSLPGTINLAAGLVAGTIAAPKIYTIEFYGEGAFTWSNPTANPPASGSFSSYVNNSNNPNNYTTSFQLVPEPSSASLMALGTVGLLALRRRRNA